MATGEKLLEGEEKNGIKKVIEYKVNEQGQKVKVTRTLRVCKSVTPDEKQALGEEIESMKAEKALLQNTLWASAKQLEAMEDSFDACKATVECLEQKLDSVDHIIGLKEKEFSDLQERIADGSKKLEVKNKQIDCIRRVSIDYLKKLGEKKKHLESLEKAFEVKERLFEETIKKFESREEVFEDLASNGSNLQLLLNQHLQRHDLIFGKTLDTLKNSHDPALLVLNAISGFYPEEGRTVEFGVSIIRRSCVILLEQLSVVSPEINPGVRDEALKLAAAWKAKMRIAAENSLEALGFLHLLAAYGLASAFNGDELERILHSVAKHKQTAVLRQRLGFADKVAGRRWSAMETVKLLNPSKRPRTESPAPL